MLRLVGCLLILSSGSGAAFLCARAERKRLDVLDGWIDLISYVRAKIDCFLTPQDEIFASLDPDRIRHCGGSAACRSFAELLDASERYLSPDSRRLAAAFTDGIGDGYREAQVRACDYYIDALRDIRGKTAAGLPARIRVRVALCLCAAIGAAILLW